MRHAAPMSSTSSPKRKLVVLTGAGMSAESGLRTFRGADGLWENHRVEDVATPEGWARDPQLVLYRWMLEEYRVSLWAQQLGTKVPVSDKRLNKQWSQVEP